ncbi:MAG: carbohydrate binding domain-containing protein, partial [Oscillospiraceae bacterium]|nr:carbohydrate binding domain-containing protein [Oscillospiraceae bacterium]
AINKGSEGYAQQFTFGADEIITNVDRYRTSAGENIAETKNLESTDNSFWAQLPAESVSTFVVKFNEKPVEPDENGYYFRDTFEGDVSDWTARGAGEVLLSGRTSYEGAESLLTMERTAAWNGAAKPLDDAVFKPGTEYSFSANVSYLDGGLTDTFYLKLQYTDANGDTQYKQIAGADAINGQWVQLANTNYKIPEDATNMVLYVETAESTNNFYIDEVIGAVGGTVIAGAGEAPEITAGDINADGVINAFDAVLARRGVKAGSFSSTAKQIAADVNSNGESDVNDVKQIQQFVAGKTTAFSVSETVTPENPTESEDSDTYMSNVSNMMVEYASAGAADEKSGVEYGTLTKYQYYSTTRERLTNVNVLLPPGYSENEKYPVLYALHGFWENEDALAKMGSVRTMLGNLISTGEAEKMIVVFPYIYTSKTQESCSGLDLANSLNYDNFINDLKADLMPYIESNFSVKTGRENTAITGFSMGGRESLFIGLTLSDKFGFVGAACPAPGLTPGADLSLHPGQLQESELKPAGEMPKLIMITGGGNDGVVGSNPSAYHNILKNNGITNLWHFVTTGSHDASSVQPHFYNYLRAIFN